MKSAIRGVLTFWGLLAAVALGAGAVVGTIVLLGTVVGETAAALIVFVVIFTGIAALAGYEDG